MTAETIPDNWHLTCLIGIKRESDSSEVQFAGFTEDITGLEFGDKDFEGQPLVNGGRVRKQTPMGDETITLKVYPVSVGLDGTGVAQHMHPQSTDDTTQPLHVLNTRTREMHRIVIVWATTLPATAEAVFAADVAGERITVSNAQIISYKPDFGDKSLSAEIKFKWSPFTKAGVANKLEESTDGTAVLPAVTATPTSVIAT